MKIDEEKPPASRSKTPDVKFLTKHEQQKNEESFDDEED